MNIKRVIMSFFYFMSGLGLVAMLIAPALAPSQIDILGPEGSYSFGEIVTVLPNGNIVVCDPYYSDGTALVGAVYLYDGSSAEFISMLTGSTAGDMVGYGGVTVLGNGNYVVSSPYWDNVGVTDAGAVTWGDGTIGIAGAVNKDNSLVGSTANDWVGLHGVYALNNGNYVVRTPWWDNDWLIDVGAVTWGDGTSGIMGPIFYANSLVGSTAYDRVGSGGVYALSNGNYVVSSYVWNNGIGAVTWGDGASGITGEINDNNSLVGSTIGDQVSIGGVSALSNGNYVVRSQLWNNGTGAVTWGDGASGITGTVSAYNSLVGSTADDNVGIGGVTGLGNGNYVVSSYYWDNGAEADAGAVTWGDGMSGIMGEVNVANSLVGSTAGDMVGDLGVTALSNSNYVVRSPVWDNEGATDAGAVTWGDGTSGITGEVSAANSLVGSTADDQVSMGGVYALSNGNYVVSSYYWDNVGAANAGAVTWGDGTSGTNGEVSAANSLVGSTPDDWVGDWGVTSLSNGNYVVCSPDWDNEGVVDAGAVTWGDGTIGITGVVSAANSLVGSTAYDYVGDMGVTALSNGNYVVRSPSWDNEGVTDAGAATWGDGASGTTGEVSVANSLVGSTAGDQVSSGEVTALSNGNYVVSSYFWDNEGVTDAGAVTWGDGTSRITGTVNAANSLVGSTADDHVGIWGVSVLGNGNYVVHSPWWDNGAMVDAGAVSWGDGTPLSNGPVDGDNSVRGITADGGYYLDYDYDEGNMRLVVGRPYDNIVTLFHPNRMPVADAGPDKSVSSGASVTLDGSASFDADGDLPLVFNWVQTIGMPVLLSGSDSANPTFTAPTVEGATTLIFRLVVSDSLGYASLPDEVIITVDLYKALLPMVLK